MTNHDDEPLTPSRDRRVAEAMRRQTLYEAQRRAKKGEEFDDDQYDRHGVQPWPCRAFDQKGHRADEQGDVGNRRDETR